MYDILGEILNGGRQMANAGSIKIQMSDREYIQEKLSFIKNIAQGQKTNLIVDGLDFKNPDVAIAYAASCIESKLRR